MLPSPSRKENLSSNTFSSITLRTFYLLKQFGLREIPLIGRGNIDFSLKMTFVKTMYPWDRTKITSTVKMGLVHGKFYVKLDKNEEKLQLRLDKNEEKWRKMVEGNLKFLRFRRASKNLDLRIITASQVLCFSWTWIYQGLN